MDAAASVIRGDRGGRLAVAEILRRPDLPGLDVALAVVRELVEVPGDRGELFGRCGGGGLAGAGPGHVVEGDQHVLEIVLLAADRVDAGAAGDIEDEAEAGTGLDGLLLLGVAGEDDLGAGIFGDAEHLEGLERGELAGFVDHDDGAGADPDRAVGDADGELVDAPVVGLEVGAELERDAPRNRGRDDVVAGLPVEVRDRAERGGLPAPGRSLDDRDLSRGGGGVDRFGLLGVDRIVLGDEPVDLALGGCFLDAVAFGGDQAAGEPVDVALGLDSVGGCEGAAVLEAGAGVVAGVGLVEFDDALRHEDFLDHGVAPLAGEESGGGVGDLLDDVGVLEDGLVPGELAGNAGHSPGEGELLFVAEFELPADEGFDEGGDVFDVPGGVEGPVDMAGVGVDAVLLRGPGHLLDGAVERAVSAEVDAEARRGVGDLDVALGPFLDQLGGGAGDAGVFAVVAMDFHRDPEARAEKLGDSRRDRWRRRPSARNTAACRGVPATGRRGGRGRG